VSDRLRTFVALALPSEQAQALAAWFAPRLERVAGVRPVPAANLHVTLVFCGLLDGEARQRVVAAVRAERSGLPPCELAPERVAALGSVVALTLRPIRGGEALAGLQARLDDRLTAEGLAEREHRPWLPHVTVARARGRARPPLGRDTDTVDVPATDLRPSGVAVYASVPMRGGVRYDPLLHIGFEEDEDAPGMPAGPRGG
jgi:2'-5' RNA ligase